VTPSAHSGASARSLATQSCRVGMGAPMTGGRTVASSLQGYALYIYHVVYMAYLTGRGVQVPALCEELRPVHDASEP
jgi:hypothetical protein